MSLCYINNLQFHLINHIFHRSTELNDQSGLKNKKQNMFLRMVSLYGLNVLLVAKNISVVQVFFFDLENKLHLILRSY